jgi:hypothetical protein
MAWCWFNATESKPHNVVCYIKQKTSKVITNSKQRYRMKLKRNLFFSITLVCFLVLLSGCEAEKFFIQESENGKKMKREITFEEFKREITQPNFSKKISFTNSTSSRSIFDFDIDTTFVKVLDKNFITYTMKLNPKFETNQNKFYNLIIYNKNSELKKIIIEFTPTSDLSSSSSQDIYQFLNNSIKAIIYPTNQNSNTLNRTDPFCPKTIYEVICTCSGQHRYNDPECTCSTFASNSYVVLTPCSDGGGTSGEDPTDPDDPSGSGNDGGIPTDPVIPTKNEDNCNDLKSKSLNQDFKDKMNELKGDSNGNLEKGYQIFSGVPKFSNKVTATPQDPSEIKFEVPLRNDCTGFMHCHLNNSTNPDANNFAIFTPKDFTGLASMLVNSTTPINEISMFLTVNNNGTNYTYAIKVKDVNKYVSMVEHMNVFELKYKKIWDDKIKTTNTPLNQLNIFLQKMKENGFDEAIEIYKCDANYQNWEQLILDANNNTKPIKC